MELLSNLGPVTRIWVISRMSPYTFRAGEEYGFFSAEFLSSMAMKHSIIPDSASNESAAGRESTGSGQMDDDAGPRQRLRSPKLERGSGRQIATTPQPV